MFITERKTQCILLSSCTFSTFKPSSSDPFQKFCAKMGNNNSAGFHRQRGSLQFPSYLQLGKNATINTTTSRIHRWEDGSFSQKGELSYTVEGSTCNLVLTKLVSRDGNVSMVTFLLHDSIICSGWESLCLQILLEVPRRLEIRPIYNI